MGGILETLSGYLSGYGALVAYVMLGLYSLGGGFVALVAAGVLAAGTKLDLWVCVSVAAVANFLGDEALFFLAKQFRGEILAKFKKQSRNLALARVLFKRYGAPVLIVKKFIYGIKTLVPLAVGFTNFSSVKFAFLNALGAVLWALVFGVGSFLASEVFVKFADKYGVFIPFVLVCILFVLVVYFKFATRKKAKKVQKMKK